MINHTPLAVGQSNDWTYWLDIAPVPVMPGHHCLTITSQWYGAKHPDEKQAQVQMILPEHDVALVAEWFARYMSRIRNG